MDEHEWRTSTDWLSMWHTMGEEFDRKRRLIATGVCRRFLPFLPHPIFLRVVKFSEAIADLLTLDNDEWEVWLEMCDEAYDTARESDLAPQSAAGYVFSGLRNDDHKIGRALEGAPEVFGYLESIKAGVLASDASQAVGHSISEHPIFLAGCKDEGGRVIGDVIREVYGNPFRPISFDPAWRTDTAITLAQQMYESRDFGAMPILADALQDAGCEDEAILSHCRDPKQVHVRGCWVTDLVLGKQ